MAKHNLAHLNFDAAGKAPVICDCGYTFGYVKRKNAERGGIEYEVYNKKNERIAFGQRSFARAVAVFGPEYDMHLKKEGGA